MSIAIAFPLMGSQCKRLQWANQDEWIALTTAPHAARKAIGSMEAQLDAKKFPRIHRSSIVNIDRVRA